MAPASNVNYESAPGCYEMSVYGSELESSEAFSFAQSKFFMGKNDVIYDAFKANSLDVNLNDYSFESSDTSVAAITSDGKINALGVGNAIIKITDSSEKTIACASVQVDDRKLISFGKKVIDCSYDGAYDKGTQLYNLNYKMTDGSFPDKNTMSFERWQLPNGAQGYATVDLGRVCEIDSAKIYFFFYPQTVTGYKISTSIDNNEFTVAYDNWECTEKGIQTIAFENPILARYVKLEITRPLSGPNTGSGVYEFEIYGDDNALAPENTQSKEIRVKEPSGIRYMAYVTTEQDLLVDASTDEFGFIVTRKDFLTANGMSEHQFTVQNALDNNITVIFGKSKYYDEQNQCFKETIWNDDFASSKRYFTGVLTGIPKTAYKDVLVARPYVLIDGVYYYGEVISSNIYDIAYVIYNDNDNPPTQEVKAYLEEILGITA